MSAYPVLLTRPLLAGFAAGVLISLGACSAANPEAPAAEAGSPQLSDQAHKRERAELHEQLAAAPAELQRKSQVVGGAVMPSVAYAPLPMSVQYAKPVVDHAKARLRTLEMFNAVKKPGTGVADDR